MSIALLLAGCDFNGPWTFYPEETEVYRGIYTNGYVVMGESPRVCFSKVYSLTENQAEGFAFYDSAWVVVSGLCGGDDSTGEIQSVQLVPTLEDPNCFAVDSSDAEGQMVGCEGGRYELDAAFKWDSSGTEVVSKFKATATIPNKFSISGVNLPQNDGSYAWTDFTGDTIYHEFAEYPYDINVMNFASIHDKSVGSVIMTMDYNMGDGGENMNTTFASMMGSLLETDSMGFTGIVLNSALEQRVYIDCQVGGYEGGQDKLDSIMLMNLYLPIGTVNLHFYATDWAYATYQNYVVDSYEDSRIVQQSNIEGGMGVFTGMRRVDVPMRVHSESFLTYDYISSAECFGTTTALGEEDAASSLACRMNAEKACFVNGEPLDEISCYPTFALMAIRDSLDWMTYMPASVSEEEVYFDYYKGINLYCFETDFTGAGEDFNCESTREYCFDKNVDAGCRSELYQWCADRKWNYNLYPACGPALVSRYKQGDMNSNILKKAAEKWCSEHEGDAVCE